MNAKPLLWLLLALSPLPTVAQEQGRIVYVTYVDSERYWLQLLKITLHK